MTISGMVMLSGCMVIGATDTAGGWIVKAGIWMTIGGTETSGRLTVIGGTATGVKVTERGAPCAHRRQPAFPTHGLLKRVEEAYDKRRRRDDEGRGLNGRRLDGQRRRRHGRRHHRQRRHVDQARLHRQRWRLNGRRLHHDLARDDFGALQPRRNGAKSVSEGAEPISCGSLDGVIRTRAAVAPVVTLLTLLRPVGVSSRTV